MSGAAPIFRVAAMEDMASIIALLADDDLGRAREQATAAEGAPDAYREAMAAVLADPSHEQLVVELDGRIVGCLHLIYIPGLSRHGALRAQIEAVRIAAPLRGQGLGKAFMEWTLDRARARGAKIAQLTTDKSRKRAHQFYRELGFTDSHVGMKREL